MILSCVQKLLFRDQAHRIQFPSSTRNLCLWRFMINCMDKISLVSNEGLWGIRLLTNQHRVDSTDRERTWASIRGYSSLCRQQWSERNRMPNSGQRKRRRGGGGGGGGGVLAIETIYELSFDHAVENHETDGEDTEIWISLNVWIVRGEILADKWNII